MFKPVFIFITLVICCIFQEKLFQSTRVPPDTLRELGHALFFETALSVNGSKSCASCHDPKFAFTDGYRTSVGEYGDHVLRNAPSLLNVASRPYLTWANDTLTTLEEQMVNPMLATHPPELGMAGHEEEILLRLWNNTIYRSLFQKAFPGIAPPLTLRHVQKAIATYERGLESRSSAYDLFLSDSMQHPLSAEALAGKKLFYSKRGGCASCHNGQDFDTPESGTRFACSPLHCSEISSPPSEDNGLYLVSKKQNDYGKFRIPSLRNVGVTNPYFHDGSVNKLEEALIIHSGAVCHGTDLIKCADDRHNPVSLTTQEIRELMAFLMTLTDTMYLHNPYFQNPHTLSPE